MLAESGAIIEYLLERHGNGRLVPARGTNEATVIKQSNSIRKMQWPGIFRSCVVL